MREFSDAEVFGGGRELSDAEVFAAPQPKRVVPTGEVARRAGSSFGNAAIAYTQAPIVGVLGIADMVGRLFGGKGDLTTRYGDTFVQPNVNAIEANALKPGEDAGTIGTPVLAAAPELGKMAGDLVYGGALSKAAPALSQGVTAATKAIPALVSTLRQGAVAGVPAGFRVTAERNAALQEAGATPLEAAIPAVASGLSTVGQFALPASAGSTAATMPGRIASRGVQGAAINADAGVVQRQIENLVLPDAAARLRVDPMDPASLIADAVGGAVFGQLGSKAETFRAPNREAMGYRPDPTLAQGATDFTPGAAEPLPVDLSAATKAVNEALFRTEGGPTPPELTLVPPTAEIPGPAPQRLPRDPLARANAVSNNLNQPADLTRAPTAPDWRLEGDPEPAAPARPTVADQVAQDDLAAAVRQRIEAEEAFKLANRRQEQADRDLRREGQIDQDYQGDDAAYKANEPVRNITLLDGEMPVMVNGMVDGRADVTWQNPDGSYSRAAVDPRRLTERQAPVNQRMAQDFESRAVDPAVGGWQGGPRVAPARPGEFVGRDTMESERMPARSTDRIAGDTSAGRADPYDPTINPRAPRGDTTVMPPEGGAVVRAQPREGNTYDQPPPRPVPPAPDNLLGDNGRRSVEGPRYGNDGGPRLPGPETPRPGGDRFVVDRDGVARPDRETYGQGDARNEAARRERIVDDYSRNDLGNTRRRNGPEPATTDVTGRPDGNGNRQLGEAPRDAATTAAAGADPNAGRATSQRGDAAAGATGADAGVNNRNPRVADPRDVPRLQVEYEKISTQAKRVATRIRNLEREAPSAKRNDSLAKAKEQLERLRAARKNIADQLTPERLPKKEAAGMTLMQALRKEGGVTPEMARDLGIDAKDPKTVNAKGLSSSDRVLAALDKNGLLEDGDDYGSVGKRIKDELRGDTGRNEGDLEQQARAREREAMEDEAKRLGIDTRDMTERQVIDAIEREAEKGRTQAEIDEANRMADDLYDESLDARTIDDILEEVGVTDKDIEDAKYRREAEVENRAAANEAEPARTGGGETAREGVSEPTRPAQQARADEVGTQPESRNQPNRARPGEGDGGAGQERPADGEARGNTSSGAQYRLNALPLDALWSGLKQALRHLVSDDSASGPLRKAIADALREAKAGNVREGIAKTLGALVWSDASVVKSVADARNSPTLHKVWRMFSDMGGTEKIHGETFEQEVHARYNRNINEVSELLKDLSQDQVKQVKALLENRQNIRGNEGAHKAARRIAEILDAERKWLADSGVEIGNTKNYVPRVYLAREVVAKAAEFRAAAERAYRMMGIDDPAAAAEAWYQAVKLKGDGVPEVPFLDLTSGAPQKNFAKTREIPIDVIRKSGLDKFLDQDLFGVLDGYFRRTSKRGAFESRFGGTDEGGKVNAKWREMRKAMEAEGNADLIEWAENRILSMSGQMKSDVGDGIRATMSLARAVTVATFLRRAVISSLTEPLQVANRTAAQGGGKAAKNALVMYAHGAERLVRAVSGIGKSASEVDRHRMAMMLGTVLHENVESGVASLRFDGDTLPNERGNVVSRAADRLSFAAMKASGLHDWTTANMVDSTIIGMDFIKAMAEDSTAGKRLANYELDRLGIAEADHAEFAKYAAKVTNADQLLADLRAGNKQAAQYVAAIDKFTRQVIMKPTAADKPVLAKHPVAQMAYGLQSWMYSYWYNVQKANIAQLKEAAVGKGYTAGERATMAGAPVLYTAAVLAMTGGMLTALRDLYAGRDKDKEREEKNKKAAIMGMPLETLRMLSQAQMFGLADPFVNSMTSARYNKLPGSELGGPAFGRVQRASMDRVALGTDKNSPNTNTAERKAAESAFNLLVDPALAVASASLPMPLAAAATFASQRDEIRQAYINESAGKKQK